MRVFSEIFHKELAELQKKEEQKKREIELKTGTFESNARRMLLKKELEANVDHQLALERLKQAQEVQKEQIQVEQKQPEDK